MDSVPVVAASAHLEPVTSLGDMPRRSNNILPPTKRPVDTSLLEGTLFYEAWPSSHCGERPLATPLTSNISAPRTTWAMRRRTRYKTKKEGLDRLPRHLILSILHACEDSANNVNKVTSAIPQREARCPLIGQILSTSMLWRRVASCGPSLPCLPGLFTPPKESLAPRPHTSWT